MYRTIPRLHSEETLTSLIRVILGYIGIVEHEMETTGITGFVQGVEVILGLYWDNGK